MSSFTAPLFLMPSVDYDQRTWVTHRDFAYEIGLKGSGLTVTIPKGTKTDLASVPRVLWPLVPPHDPQFAAAFVLHDHLCQWQGFSRVMADAILYEALRVLGASVFTATITYWSVAVWRIIRQK
jgi:hypothetical protein